MAGETDTYHESCLYTCHAVGWVAPLVHVADSNGLVGAKVLELHLAPTKDLCVTIHVCLCVYLCSVNYVHTYRSVANEPLNMGA